MKKIILAILMLSSLSMMAQQGEEPAFDLKLKALRSEKNVTVRQQKIKALENGSDEDLMVLIQYYDKNPAKKEALTKTLQKKYPISQYARMMRMVSFLKFRGIPEMEIHLQSLVKEYPNLNLDMEKSMLSSAYAEEPNSEKVLQHINAMEDPAFRLKALTMAVESMGAIDNAMALELATGKLEEAKKLKGKTALIEPLKIDPKAAYYDYINLYGKLLFNAGKYDEAYPYTAEAYNNIKERDEELIENHAFLSSLNGKYQEALPILAKAVKEGKFDQKYVEQVRKGYATLNPGKDVDAYIAELKSVFIDKIKMHVSKLLINEAAPNFTVKDVNGKTVSLADFKGKTIVLDFWATWCGPCVASFPAMQMAVNRYVNDPNVKFLFIHTWENDPNPLADAKNFLSKHDYKFDLYIDPRDPVTKHSPAADAFGIDGIPAKFIIDGQGRVRFKLSGFEGKNEAAAEEVVQMVEMARKS
ncbi:redoxin domain-containing protein [Pedobacter sp. WC2501]|uniref:redoxin domain-containing protein n=1 Tax=Pedobacter sp. WC2501 TaxID=3461400 RepID=UPI0040452EBA